MGYGDLIRKAWSTGKFLASAAPGASGLDRAPAAKADPEGQPGRSGSALDRASGRPGGPAAPGEGRTAAPGRGAIRGEMEEIVRREAAEALGCLAPSREGTMKLAPFVKFREEKFGAVLFETRTEKVFTLNPTAAAVVREILAGAPEKELGKRLQAVYSDPGGRLAEEAQALLRQLKEKGLVTD